MMWHKQGVIPLHMQEAVIEGLKQEVRAPYSSLAREVFKSLSYRETKG